jgi:hypothetical protein
MSKYINKNRKTVTTPKNKSVFSSVNLSSYNIPEIIESKNKEYIEFGADNNYFKFLINRANGSATSGACINGIAQMIYGKGLDATDSSKKPESYARMISLFKKEQVRRLAYDLKLTGQCAIQIIYSKDKKTIQKVEHLPIETLRAEKCAPDDKEVQAYYYFADWEEIKPSDEPLRIPAFGLTDTPAAIEIMYVKPYEAGLFYYSTPDYISGISFSQIEEEISNFHVNNIQNAFAPSALINFNNGVPDEATQRLIEQKFTSKFSGSSNSGKLMMAFNDSKESQADITPIQISDAHNQYEFISKEAQSKIMMSHRIVSPMLLGIKDSTGFGNNAEELKNASILMQNIVINPFQETLTDAFDNILAYNGIALNLYFKTLQPLQFIDLENVKNEETREEETGVKMSKAFDALEEFGEDEDLKDWDLIDERKVDYDTELELDEEIDELNKPSLLSKIWNLATTGTARPNAKSSQDGEANGFKYKVRYQYAPLRTSSDSREFCSKMVAKKKIYRKEDISQMSKKSVNKGWGLNGADNYDIFLYKGGGDCHHFWMRKTYRAKGKGANPDVGNPNAEVSVNKAKKEGFKPEVNAKDVAKRPTDMPNNGFVNKRR